MRRWILMALLILAVVLLASLVGYSLGSAEATPARWLVTQDPNPDCLIITDSYWGRPTFRLCLTGSYTIESVSPTATFLPLMLRDGTPTPDTPK